MKAVDLLRRQHRTDDPVEPKDRIKPLVFQGLVLCQEASPLSKHEFVPCFGKALAIVDNGDRKLYFMCGECADHNVRNRGAKLVAIRDEGEE